MGVKVNGYVCVKCGAKKINVIHGGSYLCDHCFDIQADFLRKQYGKAKQTTLQKEIDSLQIQARNKGVVLTDRIVRWRLNNGWTNDDIINTPQGGKRKRVVRS